MPVDPRMFAPVNVLDIYERTGRMREQNEQRESRKRLGDLLPQAMGYPGAMGEGGATQQGSQQDAMREIAHIDPRLFMDLNDHQRKQAAAEVDEVVGAVRWADTPEKWQQVQQRFGQMGHDVSGYTFENREGYLLQLGKIGEYLKSAPKAESEPSDVREYRIAKQEGFQGTFMDYKSQMGSPIMVDNGDGTKTLYPRSMLNGGGGQRSAPPPPPPGFVIDGGPTAPQSGGFPGSGYGG